MGNVLGTSKETIFSCRDADTEKYVNEERSM